MRRLRATFLLRCVILAACVASVLAVVQLGLATGWIVATLAIAALLWFVGIEFGLLTLALERAAVRRAQRRAAGANGPIKSIWFVDVNAQGESKRKAFVDDTADNPTLR
ncbi:MAG: hypothetical protein AB8H80_19555 [Planctomycetota bacterium]